VRDQIEPFVCSRGGGATEKEYTRVVTTLESGFILNHFSAEEEERAYSRIMTSYLMVRSFF